MNRDAALDVGIETAAATQPRFQSRGENDNLVRLVLGVAWRNRMITIPLAAAAFLFLFAAPLAAEAGVESIYFWLIAAFVFLLGLLLAVALRLRAWVVELSRQILDVADGASKPPEGAVMSALELQSEIERLREEVDRLKRASARGGG